MVALGYEGAGCASQLAALLAEPAAAALLAEAPTLKRILNPLARMLGIGVFALHHRPRPARAAPKPPPAEPPAFEPPGKLAFRSQGYTWYEVPTPPLKTA